MTGRGPLQRLALKVVTADREQLRRVAVSGVFVALLLEPPYGLASVAGLAQVVAIAAAGLLLFRHRERLPFVWTEVHSALVVVLGAALVSCFWAYAPGPALTFLEKHLATQLLLAAILVWLARTPDYRRWALVLAAVVVAASVAGIAGYLAHHWVAAGGPLGRRALSWYGSYGRAALYVGRWAPVLAACALVSSSLRVKALAWGGLAICYAFVLLTYSRAVYVALPAAVAVQLVWARRWRLLVALALGLALLLAAAPDSIWLRLLSLLDVGRQAGAIGDRGLLAKSALAMVMDHPWLGIGYGWENFRLLYPMYRLPGAREAILYNAHNLYLQILVEQGALGLIPWLALAGLVLRRLVQLWRGRGQVGGGEPRSFLELVLIGNLIVFALYSGTALWFQDEGSLDTWVMIALLLHLTGTGDEPAQAAVAAASSESTAASVARVS